MLFSSTLVKLTLVIVPVFAAPTLLTTVVKYNGEVKPNRFIVTLKPDVSRDEHIESLGLSQLANITHKWNAACNGFAGEFTDSDMNLLRANPDILGIEEDGVVKNSARVSRTDATWGLGRISTHRKLSDQNPAGLKFTYAYDNSAKTAVDVYVIDTGIFTAHPEFEGRASWGATFGPYENADGHGHGTHVAGTIISKSYGVATSAYAIAVKVLSDSGAGTTADVISGMDWVAETAPSTGRPSIASMSLGGVASTAMDRAVTALVNAGVTVVAAAGNEFIDASYTSPARSADAITVCATNIADEFARFSNYGKAVDVCAPGVDVISTWIDGKTMSISGTSMAAPHVSGLIAYMLGLNNALTPAEIREQVMHQGSPGVISNVPGDTRNFLINNGF